MNNTTKKAQHGSTGTLSGAIAAKAARNQRRASTISAMRKVARASGLE